MCGTASRLPYGRAEAVLSSCVICKQFLPDPKSLKQHLRKKHPDVQITEAMLKPTRKKLSHITQGKCTNCFREVRNVGYHVTSCVVVYQLSLARHLQDHGRASRGVRTPVPGPGDGEDGYHEQSQQAAPPRGGVATAEAGEGKRERQNRERQRKAEAKQLGLKLGGSEHRDGQYCLCAGQAMSEAGGGASGDTPREDVHAPHDHQPLWHPQATCEGVGRVEHSQGPGEGGSQLEDVLVPTHDTRTDCPSEKVQGIPGKYQRGPQSRLDFWRPSHVAISTLVPSQGLSHQGRDQQGHHSRGAYEHAGGHGRSAPERPDSLVGHSTPSDRH